MKTICSILFFIIISLFDIASAEWTLWVVPESRSIDVGDSLKIIFGVTGGGYLDPYNLKVTLYSETDSLMKKEGDETGQYDTYAVLLNKSIPKDVFHKLNIDVPPVANQELLFEAEQKTPFAPIYITPKSPGDKKVKIILSYKDVDGNWRSISEEFSYHVRSFAEQYEKIGFLLAIVVALIGIWKDALRNAFSKLKK
jgi:hypothetical protein